MHNQRIKPVRVAHSTRNPLRALLASYSQRRAAREVIRTFKTLMMLLWCTVAAAGDWQPGPSIAYSFIAPSETPASATVAEEKWIESLKVNLQKGGAKPNVVYRFAKSAASFAVSGSVQNDTVCASRDDPDIYFVVKENYARFIINFKTREVSANNYGGNIFVPPSKSFCVLILDSKAWPPGGIPITSAPGNHAIFEGRSVLWH
jgi:hypothetical protein